MKIVTLVARLLLGLTFVFFGLNGLLHFLPQPPMAEGPAKQFITALSSTAYFNFVAAIQLISGVLFLVDRFVPLALTLIAPVIVNILLFHAFMNPGGIIPGALATIFWIIVFVKHRTAFAGIFRAQS
jgi:putative oxidoreductase